MEAVFRTVLNMSLTGSYVILAILAVRLLLKKAPKKYAYALWSVAGFRLFCPVSFESILSLFRLPVFDMTTAQAENAATLTYIPQNTVTSPITSGLSAVNDAAAPIFTPDPVPNVPSVDWMEVAALVWCIGIAVMAVYSLVSYLLLRRRLSTALRVEDNVYESDAVPSPFILGFIRPRIYLPAGLTQTQKECILAHERTHLKRLDHLIKLFAYGVLVLHWFNPLCHLAFHMMSKDMEMSCDEAVLRTRADFSKAYSTTLVSLASSRTIPVPSPLAFGESGVKSRVKNILHWKKPKVWVSLAAAALCLLSLVACAANPIQSDRTDSIFGKYYRTFDNVYTMGTYGWGGHYMTYTKGFYHITEDGELLGKSDYSDENEEWNSDGTLVPWTLTEDNFDALIPSFDAVDGYQNTYDELFDLRSQVVRAWKAQELVQSTSALLKDQIFYTYVFQTVGGNIFIANGFHSADGDLSTGYIAEILSIIPMSGDSTEPPLASAQYVEGKQVYRSPTAGSLTPTSENTYIYSIEDGLFAIYERDNRSLWDAFVLSDRAWEEFPFTEAQWDAMTITTGTFGNAWELVRGSKYLDLSLQIFLLEKDGQLYICRGTHDPASNTSHIQSIHALVAEGEEGDPWAETFGWFDQYISQIITANTDSSGTLDLGSADFSMLTAYPDPEMVLRYCFTKFLLGGQTGPEGRVMAEVCKKILYNNGEADIIGHTYTSGQDWFDQYSAQAKGYMNTLGANILWYVEDYLDLH